MERFNRNQRRAKVAESHMQAIRELESRKLDLVRVTKQRDELLAALTNLVEAVEDNKRDSLLELLAAHKAIAAAKGGAA